MSVPVGTLTDAFRTDLLNFWGEHLGVLLPTPEAVEIAWTAIVADRQVTDREEIVRGPGGYKRSACGTCSRCRGGPTPPRRIRRSLTAAAPRAFAHAARRLLRAGVPLRWK
ncbi:MAG: hypothetical protein R2749_05695 [Acidimicrobiales bacterium]